MTPFQIIQGAIDAIKKYGWYCGPGGLYEGGVAANGGCVMECVAIGAGAKPDRWYVPSHPPADRAKYANSEAWVVASRAIEAVLIDEGTQGRPSAYVADAIALWNDGLCGSQEEALRVLKAAQRKVLPTPVEILAKAADTLENGRWCKGAWLDSRGGKCLDGAIESAARELLLGKPYEHEHCVVVAEDGLSYHARVAVDDELARTRDLVRDQVMADYGSSDFIGWNDRQKDKRKVIRLLRRTARNAS